MQVIAHVAESIIEMRIIDEGICPELFWRVFISMANILVRLRQRKISHTEEEGLI